MTYSTYTCTDGQFKIHRTGCRETRTPLFRFHNEWHYEKFDTVREAVNGILDEEIVEMGYGIDHIDVLPCCKATVADDIFRDRKDVFGPTLPDVWPEHQHPENDAPDVAMESQLD